MSDTRELSSTDFFRAVEGRRVGASASSGHAYSSVVAGSMPSQWWRAPVTGHTAVEIRRAVEHFYVLAHEGKHAEALEVGRLIGALLERSRREH